LQTTCAVTDEPERGTDQKQQDTENHPRRLHRRPLTHWICCDLRALVVRRVRRGQAPMLKDQISR
jgi:hypothetical protein